MRSPSISPVLTRVGLALLWLTAACSSPPFDRDLLAPSVSSCPGTHGTWTATHGTLSITMVLAAGQGWAFGPYWITVGRGTITRADDGLALAEFRIRGGESPCDAPLELVMAGPGASVLDPSHPLLAKLTVSIGFEPGGRVMRGKVDLTGHDWTDGPHPLAGVESLVFRAP